MTKQSNLQYLHHAYAARFERLEWLPFLKKAGTGEAEHPAGVPMAGQYRQAAVAVVFFVIVSHPCGGERRICGLPSPVTDDTPQYTDNAEQDQKHQPRIHRESDRIEIITVLF